MIAAIGLNRELGADNELLWHLPDDFAWFVRHTRDHPVIMGRRTMESLGKPLRNRRNMVVTRTGTDLLPGFEKFPGLEEALQSAQETEDSEIFIIGGGQIYAQALDLADRLYITRVNGQFPQADTFFPDYGDNWNLSFSQLHPVDEKHTYSFEYLILDRKTP